MITDYYATAWETDTERVRVYPDDDSTYYRAHQDNLAVIATARWCTYGGDDGAAAKAAADILDDARETGDWDGVAEALGATYGALEVVLLREERAGLTEVADPTEEAVDAVAFDTAQGRAWTGVPDRAQIAALVRSEVADYNLWGSGNGLWCIVHEERAVWQRIDRPAEQQLVTWERAGIISGVLAEEDEAVALARTEFPRPTADKTC